MSKRLVIEKVAYGKVPYGPGSGDTSVAVYFNEVEGEYDYEPLPETDGKKPTEEQNVAYGLMSDLLAKLKEADLENRWSEVLCAQTYVYFIGDCIASKENRPYSAAFLELVDKTAVEIQRRIIESRVKGDEERKSALMKQLAAPLTCFVCKPTYFTGSDDFYERFRIIICKYPLDSKEPGFNQMSVVQIGNHNFSVAIFDIDDFANQKSIIEDAYESIQAITTPPARTFIIDHKGDIEVAKYALAKGYRINRAMDYPGVCLDF